MLIVLLLLCFFFSYATLNEQHPRGSEAAKALSKRVIATCGTGANVLVVADGGPEGAAFSDAIVESLARSGITGATGVKGAPSDALEAISVFAERGGRLDVVVATREASQWKVLQEMGTRFPSLAGTTMLVPESYLWSDFLKKSNLMAIADRIVVIALIAIGMTMVIVTAGIDLSVGSLIALSAVVSTLLIRDLAGAEKASAAGMTVCCLCGIAACGLTGSFSGLMIAQFGIPPFIVTLAMMMVASGLAFIFAQGQSIYQVPDSLVWLGRGADLFGIPNTVVLMVVLYAIAHVVMTRTVVGRHIYAVGGNKAAAILSGVPVKRVLLFVYTVCGALAGLGGVVQASQLKSGAPTYGVMYELYVIAAVVVGGTSLAGGEGKILGTLIGAFIIAVIQNGMNLTGVESYTQKVALGLVLLGAVLLDRLKKRE
jgi:ribose transport system permease protein